MLVRRRDLVEAGGIKALGAEIAEDAAATKLVRSRGLSARLVDAPFGQPLGQRTSRQVWDRQARWSRLRRITFPGFFAAEILTGSLLPLAALRLRRRGRRAAGGDFGGALAAIWFGSEALLARAAGWHLELVVAARLGAARPLLPLVWVHAWLSNSFAWRGNEIPPPTAAPKRADDCIATACRSCPDDPDSSLGG